MAKFLEYNVNAVFHIKVNRKRDYSSALVPAEDTINLVAVASSYAPTPLAFEWSKNGWTLSNGENVNISATQLGIGNHQMVLTITDALDRIIFGAVADFLNMSCCGVQNPFSFNLADVAIFLGAFVLIVWDKNEREVA